MTDPDASASQQAIDLAMMQLAFQQAQRAAQAGEVPVGAVVYSDNQVIAQAHNKKEATQDPTAHAEMLVLQQASAVLGSWRLTGCSLAVTLEPCPMCAGAMINARLSRLVYATRDPKMGCVDSFYQLVTDTRFNHRLEVVEGVLAGPSSQILTDFFAKLRSDKATDKNTT